MNTITTILDNLIGPAIAVGTPLTRFEALQPTPDNRGNLDFDRFLGHN